LTVNNLGNLYSDQGKLAEVEQMYVRALAGKEKALGPDHTSTLATVNNLGNLYWAQGKLAEAEQMYVCLVSTFLWPLPFSGHYISPSLIFLWPLPFSSPYLSLAPTFLQLLPFSGHYISLTTTPL
jgi:hypothetical protein